MRSFWFHAGIYALWLLIFSLSLMQVNAASEYHNYSANIETWALISGNGAVGWDAGGYMKHSDSGAGYMLSRETLNNSYNSSLVNITVGIKPIISNTKFNLLDASDNFIAGFAMRDANGDLFHQS